MKSTAFFAVSLLLAVSGFVRADDAAQPSAADAAWFEQQVRPLLVKHCYECHAPSSTGGEIKGGLALDTRSGWMTGGESGPAIVPGQPEDSLLIQAVRYESYEMPPSGRLSAADIQILEEWVRRGAPDPRTGAAAAPAAAGIDLEAGRNFWAFQLPEAHRTPTVRDTAWPLDELDAFILSRLEQEQLPPAPPADAAAWLRRVTFDLTGLPPTADELHAFLADTSESARLVVVERLLASPQFGVHWGRHWLDVARYADSNGNDFNATYFNAWRYRDYVVDALNQDKPYDQFVREQLAGDLLPADSAEQRTQQLVATTFLMIGTKMLSERDKEKLTMDVVDEQIDTVGKAFMGLTLGCARCHDHKFDPVPTHDYYALAGIFRSTITLEGESQQYVSTWVETPLPMSDAEEQQIEEHKRQKEQRTAVLATARAQLKAVEEQLAEAGAADGRITVDNTSAVLTGDWKSSKYSPLFVGDGYLHDEKTGKGTKSVTWTPTLPRAGDYEVRISYAGAAGRDAAVPVTIRHAQGQQELTVDQRQPAPIDRLYRSLGVFPFESGTTGSVTLSTAGTTEFVIADAVQFIPVGATLVTADPQDAAQVQLRQQLQQQIADLTAQIKQQEADLKDFDKRAPQPPRAMAAREAPQIGDCEVCIRGEVSRRGPAVERGFLQVISPGPAQLERPQESGRRELADWIARSDHPLTARVMVNRIWQHMLGEGLVRSVDNFGKLGEAPSHPELLDTLAVNFVESGWSIKSLIRRIALSRTYALSTRYDEQAFQKDPDNRLLWRAHRKRLPAEALRDTMLQLSGQLDLTPGESPVAGLGALAIDNSRQDSSGRSTDGSKRSLYLPIVRNELPGFLVAFDFADPDIVTGRRPETNVPAQAMFLLNNPFVKQQALLTAERLLQSRPLTQADSAAAADVPPAAALEPDQQTLLESLYQQVLCRRPSAAEQTQIMAYLQSRPTATPQERVQAWAEVVQTLFASTEFRMLD